MPRHLRGMAVPAMMQNLTAFAMSTIPRPANAAAAPEKKRGGLLRILGVGFGLAVIVGNTIGAGILEKPGSIAAQLPRAWMFIGVWIFGGLYALLGAFPMSELGAMMPRSGGYYVSRSRTHGPIDVNA